MCLLQIDPPNGAIASRCLCQTLPSAERLAAGRLSALTDDAGFSLTELMVVIVVIGILAMIAIPRFLNVTTEAKMTEAKMMLRQVQTLQQAYFYGHDAYAADLAALGFEQTPLQSDGGTARYRIAIEQADAAGFLATATAVVDFDRDGVFNVWEVSAQGDIRLRTPD
jgi:type IV pilus assembly protein PilE